MRVFITRSDGSTASEYEVAKVEVTADAENVTVDREWQNPPADTEVKVTVRAEPLPRPGTAASFEAYGP